MTTTSDLSDRDLCLGLAERLGWAIDDLDYGRIVQWPGVGLRGCEDLLTPAGCFAVLDAMRALEWTPSLLQGFWSFGRYVPGGLHGEVWVSASARASSDERAVCEAAYDALGAAA